MKNKKIKITMVSELNGLRKKGLKLLKDKIKNNLSKIMSRKMMKMNNRSKKKSLNN